MGEEEKRRAIITFTSGEEDVDAHRGTETEGGGNKT